MKGTLVIVNNAMRLYIVEQKLSIPDPLGAEHSGLNRNYCNGLVLKQKWQLLI
jgi:hypothetical protein